MATLTNTQISVTYVGLLKTSANTVLTSTAQQITDGDGNNSIMFLSTAGVGIGGSPASGKELDVTGNVQVTGDLIVDNITIDGSTITNASGNLTIVNTVDDGDVIFQSDDGSGGVATYFQLDGSSTRVDFLKNISIADDVQLNIGDSDDLRLQHTSGNSFIQNATGNLRIIQNADDSDITFECDNASGGTTTYFSLDGSAGFTVVSKKFRFEDNVNLTVGTADDLSIFHDGTDSFIKNDTGNLEIRNNTDDGDINFRSDNGSGGLTTYLAIDGGIERVRFYKDAYFTDNVKALFGTSSDLQIYHNASHSFIQDQGTGDLRILSSKVEIFNAAASETMAKFTEDSAVELYHNGSKKFETTSTGARVQSTGTATLTLLDADDSSEVSINHNANVTTIVYNDLIFDAGGGNNVLQLDGTSAIKALENITLPDSKKILVGTGTDLEIYHDGSNSIIDNNTGDIILRCDSDDIKILAEDDILLRDNDDSTNFIHCINGGAVKLYHNGSEKLETTSTGATITGSLSAINTTAPTFDNDTHAGECIFIRSGGSAGSGNAQAVLSFGKADGSSLRSGSAIASIQTDSDADKIGLGFYTSDSSSSSQTMDQRMLLDHSGNLGIGTSPNRELHVIGQVAIDNSTSPTAGFLISGDGTSNKIYSRVANNSSTAHQLEFILGSATALTIFPDLDATFTGNVTLADSKEIQLGAGLDLRIKHDGTNSQINSGTGDLFIQNTADDKDIIFKSDDGSGGTTNYLTIDGSATLTKFHKNTKHLDSIKGTFGDSGDLEIYHNGNDSVIDNFEGDFYISNKADNEDIIFRCDDGSGGFTEYIRIDGSSTNTVFSKDLFLNDSVNLIMGNGGDYAQFHDGTNTYLSNGTGDLIIRNQADDKDIIFQSDDGSGGNTEYFRLDGGETRTIFSKDIRLLDQVQLDIGSGDDLRLVHNSHGFIQNFTGDLQIQQQADDKDILFRGDDGSGGITTYFRLDGGNTNMVASKTILYEDSVKASFGSSEDLKIKHDGTNSSIENITGDLTIQNGADDKDIVLKTDNGSGLVTDYIRLDGSDVSTKILTQKVILSNLPTSDPNNAGQLYNESGFLRVSAG